MHRPTALIAAALLLVTLAGAASAADPGAVNQRDDGWPKIDGMMLINADHGSRPLDARVGSDPFGGQDPTYSCDTKAAEGGPCLTFLVPCGEKLLCVGDRRVHNELLGGHGNDTIYAGPSGDVVWGDFLPGGGAAQVDRLTGGDGRDFIYGSKGRNVIKAGAGDDFVKSRYGRGRINCGPGNDILYTSRRYKRRYKITGCERQSTGPSPGQGGTPAR
ncbi:MAG TPA: calcium-binding protein [Solirubrobacteraceae bacterium]|jgi:Ca2+-binding RTX toxin-like protein